MRIVFAVVFLATLLPGALAQNQSATAPAGQSQGLGQAGIERITKEVRHELLLLLTTAYSTTCNIESLPTGR